MNRHKVMALSWVGIAALFAFTYFAPGWAVFATFTAVALLMAVYEWRRR